MHATKSSAVNSRREQGTAGFTLIELMVVVAIIGVLATLASYGVRKYILESKRSEAVSMLTAIRGAEEAYRDERFVYLGLDKFNVWHPVDDPGGAKWSWGAGNNAMTVILSQLGVVSDGPVNYSYSIVAGTVGTTIPSIPMQGAGTFPAPTGPFYIAMGLADLDDDGKFTYALTHSDGNGVAMDGKY